MRHLNFLTFLSLLCFSTFGCGAAEDGSPTAGAPPQVEAGTEEYDSYSNSGRQGPGEGK